MYPASSEESPVCSVCGTTRSLELRPAENEEEERSRTHACGRGSAEGCERTRRNTAERDDQRKIHNAERTPNQARRTRTAPALMGQELADSDWFAELLGSVERDNSACKQLIPQAAALTTVFGCKEHGAFAAPEHLGSLMQGLIIPNAELAITEGVTEVADCLSRLAAVQTRQRERTVCVAGKWKVAAEGRVAALEFQVGLAHPAGFAG